MAVCLAAFVTGLAAQVALLSLVCAYAGSMLGFASGVAGSLLATLQLGAGILHQGVPPREGGGRVECAAAAASCLVVPMHV